MSEKAKIYRHEFLICPWCEEESGCRVDHLYDGSEFANGFGPWYCKKCRRGFTGRVKAPNDVILEKWYEDKFLPAISLLKSPGTTPTYYVVRNDRYVSGQLKTEREYQDHDSFFFHEHSCPTNWIGKTILIAKHGDLDPHGFLTFVRSVVVRSDFDPHDDEEIAKIFPEILGGDGLT